jgi:23S rRNA maturation mini-RNase III
MLYSNYLNESVSCWPQLRNVEQAVLRQATAFEALIGYRFLTDEERLKQLLDLTDLK